jgi:hypothetical protein
MMTDSILSTVKYHAYLRKMTRYNPTRGGMISILATQLSNLRKENVSDS